MAMRLLAILAAILLLGAAPAPAQVRLDDGDRLFQDDAIGDRDLAATARDLMARTLPFKHGQTLRYYDEEGDLQGYARRHRLTIRFYEPDGTLVGRAERMSQAATSYYAADGRYLGRRLHKKQTAKTRVVEDSGAKGFRETTKPTGQPGDLD
jgi:hypothetical protein